MNPIQHVCLLLRAALHAARTAHFMTSDQGYSGFMLSRVCDADGEELTYPPSLEAEVDDLVGGIEWDGVMRESPRGYSVLDLETGLTASDGV